MSAVSGQGVRIELLGGFRVTSGERQVPPVAWPSRRAAELVQLLALADTRSLLRDEVIEALWPHLDPRAGAANLRKAAHHARTVLGDPDAVVLRQGRVLLYPERQVETDVDRFDSLVQASQRGDLGAARAAISVYGELLPQARYDDWAERHRERLRQAHLDVLRQAEQWRRVVELEPTDESACRALMREALARGDRAAAIEAYGRLRLALRRELGVSPSRETQSVYDECIAAVAEAENALLGREPELASLAGALRSRPGSAPSAIVVRGPAGIGKSVLCREAALGAEAGGWFVVRLRAVAGDRSWSPLTAAVERLLLDRPDLLDEVGDHVRSVLAALTSLPLEAQPLTGPLSRHQVIGAVRRVLLAAAAGAPVLVVLDDAHLADDATVATLAQLGTSGGTHVLPLLAYRPERASPELAREVTRLTDRSDALHLDLGPLGREDARALVVEAAPHPLDVETVDRVVAAAHGVPFFLLQMARAAPTGRAALPVTVGEAIAARLNLGDAALAYLTRVALAGGDVDPLAATALGPEDGADPFGSLDLALRAGVLVVVDERYRFSHDLIGQALVERVPPHARPRLHREVAERLEGAGVDPGRVAHHWLEARDGERAVPWLLEAARQAVGLAAFSDALRHLDPLLRHAPEHVEALCLRAEALDALGHVAALPAYAEAVRVAGEPLAQELLAKRGLAQIKLGDPPGAVRTVRGAQPVTVAGRLAKALTLSGAAALGFADAALGTAMAAECRRLALESGDRAALVVASWAQAAAAHARGELRRSVRADLQDTWALPALAVSVFDGQLCITQRLLYGARPYPDVIAFADALEADARRLGATRGHAFAVTLRGEAELLAGRLEEAERDLMAAAELHRAIGAATGEAFSLQRLAEAALYRGDAAEAAGRLAEALCLARESDVGFHLLDRIYGTRMALASSSAAPGAALAAVEEAEAAVQGPLETCPGCRITFVVPAAIASARAGDLTRAAAYVEQTEYLASIVMRLPAWHAALDEVRGHLARASGDAVGAARHLGAAADGFRRAGQPLDAERCRAACAALAPAPRLGLVP